MRALPLPQLWKEEVGGRRIDFLKVGVSDAELEYVPTHNNSFLQADCDQPQP